MKLDGTAKEYRQKLFGRYLEALGEQSVYARELWSIPTYEKGTLGGELWLFEVLDKGRYHAVNRCCLEVAVGKILDKTLLSKMPAKALPVIENFRPLAEIAVLLLQDTGVLEFKET